MMWAITLTRTLSRWTAGSALSLSRVCAASLFFAPPERIVLLVVVVLVSLHPLGLGPLRAPRVARRAQDLCPACVPFLPCSCAFSLSSSPHLLCLIQLHATTHDECSPKKTRSEGRRAKRFSPLPGSSRRGLAHCRRAVRGGSGEVGYPLLATSSSQLFSLSCLLSV